MKYHGLLLFMVKSMVHHLKSCTFLTNLLVKYTLLQLCKFRLPTELAASMLDCFLYIGK